MQLLANFKRILFFHLIITLISCSNFTESINKYDILFSLEEFENSGYNYCRNLDMEVLDYKYETYLQKNRSSYLYLDSLIATYNLKESIKCDCSKYPENVIIKLNNSNVSKYYKAATKKIEEINTEFFKFSKNSVELNILQKIFIPEFKLTVPIAYTNTSFVELNDLSFDNYFKKSIKNKAYGEMKISRIEDDSLGYSIILHGSINSDIAKNILNSEDTKSIFSDEKIKSLYIPF